MFFLICMVVCLKKMLVSIGILMDTRKNKLKIIKICLLFNQLFLKYFIIKMITEKQIQDFLNNVILKNIKKVVYTRLYTLEDLMKQVSINIPVIYLKNEKDLLYMNYQIGQSFTKNKDNILKDILETQNKNNAIISQIQENIDWCITIQQQNCNNIISNVINTISNNIISCNTEAVNTIQWMLNTIQQYGWTQETMNYIVNTLASMQQYFNSNVNIANISYELPQNNISQDIKVLSDNILQNWEELHKAIQQRILEIGGNLNITAKEYIIVTNTEIKYVKINTNLDDNDNNEIYDSTWILMYTVVRFVWWKYMEIYKYEDKDFIKVYKQIIEVIKQVANSVSFFSKVNKNNIIFKHMINVKRIWKRWERTLIRRKVPWWIIFYQRPNLNATVIKEILKSIKQNNKKKRWY